MKYSQEEIILGVLSVALAGALSMAVYQKLTDTDDLCTYEKSIDPIVYAQGKYVDGLCLEIT